VAEVWAPIKLVHFGAFSANMSRDLLLGPDEEHPEGFGQQPCTPAIATAGPASWLRCMLLRLTRAASVGSTPPNARPLILLCLPAGRPGYGCFDPAKDVMLAPYSDELAHAAHETFETEAGKQRLEGERPILLAFAGGLMAASRLAD
jgi:hypothetical protein